MHACMHACMHMHAYACICMHACMHAFFYAFSYACMHAYSMHDMDACFFIFHIFIALTKISIVILTTYGVSQTKSILHIRTKNCF